MKFVYANKRQLLVLIVASILITTVSLIALLKLMDFKVALWTILYFLELPLIGFTSTIFFLELYLEKRPYLSVKNGFLEKDRGWFLPKLKMNINEIISYKEYSGKIILLSKKDKKLVIFERCLLDEDKIKLRSLLNNII